MNIKQTQQKISQLKEKVIIKTELARALGFSRQYISQLFENNKELSPDKIQRLEKYFGVSLEKTQDKPSPEADADIKQVMELYVKFRDNKDIEAGEFLEEKIHLMLKILKSQK